MYMRDLQCNYGFISNYMETIFLRQLDMLMAGPCNSIRLLFPETFDWTLHLWLSDYGLGVSSHTMPS